METISITTTHGSSSTILTGNALGELDRLLNKRRAIIITDSNIYNFYEEIIDRYEHIIIGQGESNKNLVTVEQILRELMSRRADRSTFILGFGGGIVTDIAGFVATTYMRGVDFGFISSTLLGQVDASVGGKNGVNVGGYKNMVGTFNQPEFVICDTALLQTLPEREFKAGLAEVLKSGIIDDPILFGLLENNSVGRLRNDNILLEEIVTRAIKVKVSIVERDEYESGERRKLNLGHTFAHAIEAVDRRYQHGEAVAIGMAMAVDMASISGLCTAECSQRIKNALESMGLPTHCPIDSHLLMEAVKMDKKGVDDSIMFVFPQEIGTCTVRKTGLGEIEDMLKRMKR